LSTGPPGRRHSRVRGAAPGGEVERLPEADERPRGDPLQPDGARDLLGHGSALESRRDRDRATRQARPRQSQSSSYHM
jgi:hypothetical protein